MSFFEGLHADLTRKGGGRPWLVRLFLAVLKLLDRLKRHGA